MWVIAAATYLRETLETDSLYGSTHLLSSWQGVCGALKGRYRKNGRDLSRIRVT
jgi:hypothetical protein